MKLKAVLILTLVFIAVFSFSVARAADDAMNLQFFRPSVFGGNFLAIQDSHTLAPWTLGGGLYFDYANGVFNWVDNDNNEFHVISELATGHAALALGMVEFMSLGVEVPFSSVRYRPLEDFETNGGLRPELESKTAMGDMLAELKFRLLYQARHGIGWAIAPYATFPTGDEKLLIGEGRATFGGTMMFERDFGLFNLAANGGFLYRGTTKLLDNDVAEAWKYGAGISRDYSNGLGFAIEYWGAKYNIKYKEPKDLSPFALSGKLDSAPAEVTFTLRYAFGGKGPRLIAGGNASGGKGVGTPAYRILGGVDYFLHEAKAEAAPPQGKLTIETADAAGNATAADVKITGGAGAPQAISSTGRIERKLDAGSYVIAASKAGFVSASETIELTAGGNKKVKLVLKEAPKAAVKTALAITITDKCSGEKLTAEVSIGEPGAASKAYSVPAEGLDVDLKPAKYMYRLKLEDYTAKVGEFTVEPDKKNDLPIKLVKRFEIKDKVFFDTGSVLISEKSIPVLDALAERIKKQCDYKKVVIAGHTANEGTDEQNLDLSKRRAQVVKEYLVGKGVDASKLEITGFGGSRPAASNFIGSGRDSNRRVEFTVED